MINGVLFTYLLLFSLGCGGAVSLGIFYKCLQEKVLKHIIMVFIILLFSLLRNIAATFYEQVFHSFPLPLWAQSFLSLILSLMLYGSLFLLLLDLREGHLLQALVPTLLILLIQISRILLFYYLPPQWMDALYLPSMASISLYNFYIGLSMVNHSHNHWHYSLQKLLKWLGRITLFFSPASLVFYLIWYYMGMRQRLIISLDFLFLSLWSFVALLVLLNYLARMGQLPGHYSPSTNAVDLYGLTPRELEVLAQVMKGLTNKEIGDALFISSVTVRTHVSRLIEKTGVRNRVELVAKMSRESGA